MRRLRDILAIVYPAGGIGVWVQFTHLNHNGLANVGILLYVLPITLVGVAITALTGQAEFVLIPSHFGYLTAHAIFYFPSLFVVAIAIAGYLPKVLAMYRARHRGRPAL